MYRITFYRDRDYIQEDFSTMQECEEFERALVRLRVRDYAVLEERRFIGPAGTDGHRWSLLRTFKDGVLHVEPSYLDDTKSH